MNYNPTAPSNDTVSVHETLREFHRLLEERIRAEAAKSRRGRILGWMALILALLGLVASGGLLYYAFYQGLPVLTSPSLRAHEIVLVDGAGNDRGRWAVDPDGSARLVLMDADGVDRLKLTLTDDAGQAISLADPTGANRIVLSLLPDEGSSLAFANSEGTTRAVLGTSAADVASLLFADANGGTRAAMGLSPTGEPTFWWPDLEISDNSR